jgi:hypothetical protein
MKNVLIRIATQTAPIAIFICVFFASALMVSGYRYDFKENAVVQTGVIDVCSLEKNAHVYLDNKLYSNEPCAKIVGLELGHHKIEVRKPGYVSWEKNVYVDPRMAKVYKNFILMPHTEYRTEKTLISAVEDTHWLSWGERLIQLQEKENAVSAEGFEVWLKNNRGGHDLITRRAEKIEYADFFYNEGNVLIATAKKVEICDLQGENCQFISKKDPGTPVAHGVNSKTLQVVLKGKLIQINLEGNFDETLETQNQA